MVAGDDGDRRFARGAGQRPELGGRPSPPPRVLRQEGDPHSPWLFGTSTLAVARGFWHAHMAGSSTATRPTSAGSSPTCSPTGTSARVDSKSFVLRVASASLLPALLGGLISWSWRGALTALLLGRAGAGGALHHVTWSINSICHMVGARPFRSRDRSAQLLAVGGALDGRVVAQPAPCRPDMCPARRAAAGRSTSRPPSSERSNGGGGRMTSGGPPPAVWSGCGVPDPALASRPKVQQGDIPATQSQECHPAAQASTPSAAPAWSGVASIFPVRTGTLEEPIASAPPSAR